MSPGLRVRFHLTPERERFMFFASRLSRPLRRVWAGRSAHYALHPLCGGFLSWHASGFVKTLTHHKDGTRLSAREKLILFVLADSHNESRGNCAWIGIEKAAHDSLTSRSRFLELLKRLESKGTISIERREGKSNLYRFPDLPVRESDPPAKQNSTTPVQPQDPTRPIAIGPKPLEPLGTDIQPRYARPVIDMAQEAIRESQRTGEEADAILERLRQKNALPV